ncbi:winged helix-turn-helix domain-containing protein [Enterobacter sp. BNK-8]|uniref:winged helix-turn-helix domain-containing protein n=1 Tax=Enterobacter sp. BNK-8 TaxID=3376145 RepID=UPI003B50F569
MIFIIEQEVVYSPDDGKISCQGDSEEESIILTPVLNRILLILVERHGELVTRDEFLTYVWDDFGKSGSTNTLIQYVSTLRRIFEPKFDKEFIITIPRLGYMLNSEIMIIQQNELSSETKANDSDNEDLAESAVVLEKTSAKTIASYKNYYFLLSIFGLCLSAVVYILFPTNTQELRILTNYKSCPVFTNNSSESMQSLDDFNDYLKYFEIKCTGTEKLFFLRYNHNASGGNKYILSVCSPSLKSGQCLSFSREMAS